MSRTATALACSLLLAAPVLAQPGALDPTFGDDGVVVSNLSRTTYHLGYAVAVQHDGRIVVAGGVIAQPGRLAAGGGEHAGWYGSGTAVVRYLPDGTLDPSFGDGGGVVTPFNYGSIEARDVVIQPDGRIVVVVWFEHDGDYALVRYLPDGALDPSFGDGGIVVTEVPGTGADCLALQEDGYLVVGGDMYVNQGYAFAFARYAPDGSLDPSFGNDGLAFVEPPSPDRSAEILDVAIDGQGRIVGSGEAHNDDQGDFFAVVRLLPDGTPDATFGEDGIARTYAGDTAQGMAIQPDNRIVVTGSTWDGASRIVLARFLPDGALDPAFGDGGIVVSEPEMGSLSARDVVLRPDGKIAVTGNESVLDDDDRGFVAQYEQDGSLDLSFGMKGITSEGLDAWWLSGMALQPDGSLVVTGSTSSIGYSGYYFMGIATARFTPEGEPDPGFGDDGRVVTYGVGHGEDRATAAVMTPEGSFIVAGYSEEYGCALARYTPDGALDLDYGTGGVASIPGCAGSWEDVALLDDGSALTIRNVSGDYVFARFDASGELDPTFGNGGLATYDQPDWTLPHPDALLVQPDGKIVVASEDGSFGTNSFTIFRLLPDATPDPTFGENGVVVTEGFDFLFVYDATLLPDGRLVVGGGQNNAFILASFLQDGSFDPSFGLDGIVRTGFAGQATIFALARYGEDRIIAAGGNEGRFALARYLHDGSLDPTFDGDGRTTVEVSPEYDYAFAVTVQSDSKVVAAGYASDGDFNDPDQDFALARLKADGSLDSTFGDSGVTTTSFRDVDEGAVSVFVQASGRIVAVGTAGDIFQSDIALAGYLPVSIPAVEPDTPAGMHPLSEAHPNPFVARTRFTVEVAAPERVTVAVFDALGRRVATLHEGPLTTGTAHPFVLEGAGLASGLYVVRAVGETFAASRRVALVR
jgi:uncharacterized delta-60 repeat protein